MELGRDRCREAWLLRSVGRTAAWRPPCAQHSPQHIGKGRGVWKVELELIYFARKIHFHVLVCSHLT